jgi:hypothetical protein
MKMEQKSKHGGAREGAGRKPKLQYEARELFYSAVDARWDTILAKLDKLITRGDFHALRWVLEQRIGRAPQSVEMDITTKEQNTEPSPRIKRLSDMLVAVQKGVYVPADPSYDPLGVVMSSSTESEENI